MAKFEEVLPAFREGKRIRKKGCDWLQKDGTDMMIYSTSLWLADDWEVEKEPIKYSVELWGNEWKPCPERSAFDMWLLGRNCLWSDTKYKDCPIKYRVTVEEVPEQ